MVVEAELRRLGKLLRGCELSARILATVLRASPRRSWSKTNTFVIAVGRSAIEMIADAGGGQWSHAIALVEGAEGAGRDGADGAGTRPPRSRSTTRRRTFRRSRTRTAGQSQRRTRRRGVLAIEIASAGIAMQNQKCARTSPGRMKAEAIIAIPIVTAVRGDALSPRCMQLRKNHSQGRSNAAAMPVVTALAVIQRTPAAGRQRSARWCEKH